MSVFTLSKAAPLFFKDARTLRRWCEKGLVPGAYRTKGGHWRIRAKSPQSIKPRVNGFARMGKGRGEPFNELARLARRPYFKAALAACDALIDNEQLAAIVDMDDLSRGSWRAVEGINDLEVIKIRAVRFWMLRAFDQDGRTSMTAIARAAGLPRNTFVRHFSQYISDELRYDICGAFPGADELTEQTLPKKVVVSYEDDFDDPDYRDARDNPRLVKSWWDHVPDPKYGFDERSFNQGPFYADMDEGLGWREPTE